MLLTFSESQVRSETQVRENKYPIIQVHVSQWPYQRSCTLMVWKIKLQGSGASLQGKPMNQDERQGSDAQRASWPSEEWT